jgi:hypothetical protein
MEIERYTPSRLEWLVLNIEAKVPMFLSQVRRLTNVKSVDDIRVYFRLKEPDTVVVVVRFVKDIPQNVVDALDQGLEKEIYDIAKYYGWENWLKLEWDVR